MIIIIKEIWYDVVLIMNYEKDEPVVVLVTFVVSLVIIDWNYTRMKTQKKNQLILFFFNSIEFVLIFFSFLSIPHVVMMWMQILMFIRTCHMYLLHMLHRLSFLNHYQLMPCWMLLAHSVDPIDHRTVLLIDMIHYFIDTKSSKLCYSLLMMQRSEEFQPYFYRLHCNFNYTTWYFIL